MLNMKDEKGIALVLALILMVVLSILAVAMVFLGRYETGFLVKERQSDAALYIADGGVEYATNRLRTEPNYRGPTSDFIGNGGQFTVSVSTQGQPAQQYEITSTGYVPNATNPQETRTVRSVINISEEISDVFQHAIASSGPVTLGGNAVINSDDPTNEGDIYSGGDITLEDNATINGDASAVGTITTEGNSTITGEQSEGTDPLDFPEIDRDSYVSEAQTGGTYSGDFVVTIDTGIGPLYIDGNLVIGGNHQVTLTGTVFVTGSVTLSGSPDTYSFSGQETLIADGDITMQGTSGSEVPLVMSVSGNVTLQGNISTQGTVIYAPQGTVTIEGNPDITGVIVGQQVNVQGSVTITRKVDLTGYPLPGGGSSTTIITVVSWQES
ncbi:MAG: PilX N-terminal domain-containing pilus assembly protein [bacterium]